MNIIKELQQQLGTDKVLIDKVDLICYSYDSSTYSNLPAAVLVPENKEDICQIMKLATKYKTPVVARGGGTSLSGGCIPLENALVLDTHKLNSIKEIDTKNLVAVVETGVITSTLHKAVEKLGLFYPPDPQSMNMSTIGGNIAVNAGGPRCFKYGVTKDYLLGLEVVLANGDILKIGGKTIKNVSGYDLIRLFAGSEGTLGIITEAVLRLIPLPQAKRTALAIFNTLEDAANAVSGIIEEKIVPATLELMDQDNMNLIEAATHVGYPTDVEAAILIEVDGRKTEVNEDINLISAVCKKLGACEVRIAQTPEESNALWAGRKAAYGCLAQNAFSVLTEDATVPRSQLVPAVRAIKAIAKKYNLNVPIIGHSGDGNLHPTILCDERNPDEALRAKKCLAEIAKAALELGGTLSGEHGIGICKREFMPWEFGETGMAVIKSIKEAFDPLYILNPGKIISKGEEA